MSESPATSGTTWKPRVSENGHQVIRIGRKGRKLFAFGEEGKPFEVDVVALHSEWVNVDRTFRDEKGDVPSDRLLEMNKTALEFVMAVGRQVDVDLSDISLAEALEFIKEITEEVHKLKDFFVPKFSDAPSSPESTELRFST